MTEFDFIFLAIGAGAIAGVIWGVLLAAHAALTGVAK